MTWAEFEDLTQGLLARDSALNRHFAPKNQPDDETAALARLLARGRR